MSTHRPLREIANEISDNWPKPYFGAVPYLDAMKTLDHITGHYFDDSASEIVMYFLANANTWRGEKARAIKKELNAILKSI